jgi:hypothetical protein
LKSRKVEESENQKVERRADWAAWVALAVAAGLRVAGAWGARAVTDMDTSVVALMARHMAHGTDWPVFFYGQAYMGSLEPAGSALLMRLFGDGGFALTMGPVLFSLAAMWALWRWARDAAGAIGGAAALALAAAGPLVWFQFQYAARGGYMVSVLVDALALWGASRLAADWWAGKGGGAWRAAALGVLAGVGVWTDPIVVPALAAAVAVLLVGMRGRVWEHKAAVAAGVAGTAVGASPWWVWWMVHGGNLLALPPSARSPLRRAVELTWNRWLLFQGEGMSAALCGALAVGALALAVAGIWAWLANAKKAGARANFATLGAVLFLGAFAAAFVLSGFNQAHTGRYWVPAWPAVALLAGWACAGRGAAWRRRGAWAVAAALFAVQTGIVLYHVRATVARAPKELARIEDLRDAVLSTGADALMAPRQEYPMNFSWGEALPVSDGLLRFYPPIRVAAELAENPAYCADWMGLPTLLERIAAEAEISGGGRVFSNVRAAAPKAATAWALGAEAAPEAELRWDGARGVSAVGFWLRDFRGLRRVRVDVDVLEGGEWRRVHAGAAMPAVSWSGTRAYLDGGEYQEFPVASEAAEGVRVTLQGLPEGASQPLDLVAYGTEAAGNAVPEAPAEMIDAIVGKWDEASGVFAPRWLSNRLLRDGRIKPYRLFGLSPLVFGTVEERENAERHSYRGGGSFRTLVVCERRHAGVVADALSGAACEAVRLSAWEEHWPDWAFWKVEKCPYQTLRRGWTGRWFTPLVDSTD